jgi:hypothetical protein
MRLMGGEAAGLRRWGGKPKGHFLPKITLRWRTLTDRRQGSETLVERGSHVQHQRNHAPRQHSKYRKIQRFACETVEHNLTNSIETFYEHRSHRNTKPLNQ